MAVSVNTSGTNLLTGTEADLFTAITAAGTYVLAIDPTGASFGDEQTWVVRTFVKMYSAEASTQVDERIFRGNPGEIVMWFPVPAPIEYLVRVLQPSGATSRTIKYAVYEL